MSVRELIGRSHFTTEQWKTFFRGVLSEAAKLRFKNPRRGWILKSRRYRHAELRAQEFFAVVCHEQPYKMMRRHMRTCSSCRSLHPYAEALFRQRFGKRNAGRIMQGSYVLNLHDRQCALHCMPPLDKRVVEKLATAISKVLSLDV